MEFHGPPGIVVVFSKLVIGDRKQIEQTSAQLSYQNAPVNCCGAQWQAKTLSLPRQSK